jgi:3-oxo-5-alpha-steroid 4-dehydrogenase 1
MLENFKLEYAIYAWIAIAVVLFPVQLFVSAPYGRHTKTTWGPMLSNKLGWVLMEGWAPVVFLAVFCWYYNPNPYALFLAVLYVAHYIHRSFIYPLRTRTQGKQMPLLIALSAMLFNSVNASVIGYYLSELADFPVNYFTQWNFILGLIVFAAGFVINYKSDDILIHLRKPGETGYKIPQGFLFRYISCPNHFGEIIEWLGFMLMCWNLAGVSFFVWTASNLIPRALHHHKWYLEKFKDYPKERKAVIPFVL